MIARTWCPQCGPGVPIDEDGCCATCGATATGRGVDAVLPLRHRAECMCAAIVAAVLAGWDPDSCARVQAAALAYRDAYPEAP